MENTGVTVLPAQSGQQISEYASTDAAIAILRGKYEAVTYDVTSPAGMKAAREARAEVKGYRVELEKTRQRIKAPALERARLIDAEAKRITAALEALELPIDEQIKREEARKEAERAERERQERARLAAIHEQIESIRRFPYDYLTDPSAEIAGALADLRTTNLALFDETHRPDAESALAASIAKLEEAHAAALAREAESARMAEERAELARQRAAMEAERAEADRVAAEARAEADRVARVERERVAAELRASLEADRQREAAARAERERIEGEARRAAEVKAAAERAEMDRIAAAQRVEAERLQRERAAFEAQARADEIAAATLIDAAREVLELLAREGLDGTLPALKLASALTREAPKVEAPKRARKASAA